MKSDGEASLIQKTLDTINRFRSEGTFPSDKITQMDTEALAIRNFIDNLAEDEHIPIKDRENELSQFLKNIAEGKEDKIKSKELINLVQQVRLHLDLVKAVQNRPKW